MKAFKVLLEYMGKFELGLSCFALIVMTLLYGSEIVSRWFFSGSVIFVQEVTKGVSLLKRPGFEQDFQMFTRFVARRKRMGRKLWEFVPMFPTPESFDHITWYGPRNAS